MLIPTIILLSSASGAPVTYKDFVPGSTTVASQKIAFRLFIPKNYSPLKKYPIMVTLHGAGERGIDDSTHLTHYFNRVWADSAAQAISPSFVLAPQCPPPPHQWVNAPFGGGTYNFSSTPISTSMQAVVTILDSLAITYSLDPNRYYVSGLSMGGYGTWFLAMKYPGKFAAVVPICGGADSAMAPSIAKVPIWAFHSEDDYIVPVSGSRDMITALKNKGGDPKYTEYPSSQNVGHASWVPAAQSLDLIKWVYSQTLAPTSFTLKPSEARQPPAGNAWGLENNFFRNGLWTDAMGRKRGKSL